MPEKADGKQIRNQHAAEEHMAIGEDGGMHTVWCHGWYS